MFNTLDTGWFSHNNIHGYQVALAGNSNAVCFCRRQILLGVFQLQAEMVSMANILLPLH